MNVAIILAGGSGVRFGQSSPKQFVKVSGKSILEHTLDKFNKHNKIDEIVLVTNPAFLEFTTNLLENQNYTKLKVIVKGGPTRRESSKIGISNCHRQAKNVLIHDAVRPFVSDKIIDDCLEALTHHHAVDVAIPAADTIIKIDSDNLIEDIPNRKWLWRGQTPQAFKFDLIHKAHQLADSTPNIEVTDDCGLILKFNLGPVFVVRGDSKNIKITQPEDLHLADKLFQLKTTDYYTYNPDFLRKQVQGRQFVIFGGNSGLGLSIAKLIEKFGGIPNSFSRKNGVDVRNENNILSALESVREKGEIYGVINTAGILRVSPIRDKSFNSIKEEIDTNYLGTVNVAYQSLPFLKETKGALLFFTSSSYTRGRGGYSIYSSSKAAIVNFTQGLAEEVAPNDVRINVISPERTNTPMRRANFAKEDPSTLLSPNQVARAAVNTLFSGQTGQVIDVRINQIKI